MFQRSNTKKEKRHTFRKRRNKKGMNSIHKFSDFFKTCYSNEYREDKSKRKQRYVKLLNILRKSSPISDSKWNLSFTPLAMDDFTGIHSVQGFIAILPGKLPTNKVYLNMEEEEKNSIDEKIMTSDNTLLHYGSMKAVMEYLNLNEKVIGENFRQDSERINYSFDRIDSIESCQEY
uniref:Uncharacterized protein n=1 Tax=Strongyloides papillosus TaxID=174720 RepID=A0A0N5BKS5_STREA